MSITEGSAKSASKADALRASPELPVTISPAELGVLADLACNASAPVGRVLQLGDLFARLVKLANQRDPIGAVSPSALMASGKSDFSPQEEAEALARAVAEGRPC